MCKLTRILQITEDGEQIIAQQFVDEEGNIIMTTTTEGHIFQVSTLNTVSPVCNSTLSPSLARTAEIVSGEILFVQCNCRACEKTMFCFQDDAEKDAELVEVVTDENKGVLGDTSVITDVKRHFKPGASLLKPH